MRAGQLRHLVEIQSRVTTKNAYNEPETTYQTFIKVYASKRQPGGREFFGDGVVQNEITTIFEIRHNDRVREDMRVVYRGDVYDIRHISDPTGKREALVLACVLRR